MTQTPSENLESNGRSLSLFQATSVGVGAIVGGGILALAGVAFATTGPSALLAFALNGIIALLTALSFAEMAAAFPESGGTYTFAKKVMTVRAAFAVGWVVWFASIVAAVLYALGFATFAVIVLQSLWPAAPAWLANRWIATGLALLATAVYTLSLTRSSGGGGAWINVGKVLVFGILIAAGLAALPGAPAGTIRGGLQPFFAAGAAGLVQAMGYTFIALQGFDLIAAVAGEVRQPQRTIPRAMLASLGIALLIYLPLLLVVATVGMAPGQDVRSVGAAQPENLIAIAAQNFMGTFGYWLVLVAGLLSMLSALQANLYAASRLALAMARDRTLPHRLEQLDARRGTPATAVFATAAIVALLLLILPDVAAAGAASSLIFLITFALAHVISMLMRRRGGGRADTFRVPAYPAVPLAGVAACIGLAAFQGVSVPAAGIITALWLGFGGLLFLALFARRAEAVDAAAEAR
ncbi:MAG: amino acid permease, partial [Anaerolineales bacterium]|nr:amino acid permease [Anaerolineales bacterium]